MRIALEAILLFHQVRRTERWWPLGMTLKAALQWLHLLSWCLDSSLSSALHLSFLGDSSDGSRHWMHEMEKQGDRLILSSWFFPSPGVPPVGIQGSESAKEDFCLLASVTPCPTSKEMLKYEEMSQSFEFLFSP